MSRLRPVKLALLGCGRIAQLVHLRVLTSLPGARLVALAEADPRRRAQAARWAPDAATFADYQSLLDRSNAEAIIVCLPNDLHAEAARAVLDYRKHLYLEKPLATDLAEAHQVIAAWQRAGTVGMIGFNYRFHPLFRAAQTFIQSGQLGELVGARSAFATASREVPDWKQSRARGGGVLLDLASHHVDLVRYLLEQEVRSVQAQVSARPGWPDSASVGLRLESGLLVQSFFSAQAVEEDRFEVYGRAGKLAVDRHLSLDLDVTRPQLHRARLTRLWHAWRSLVHPAYLLGKFRGPGYLVSYQLALGHFVHCVRRNVPADPSLRDGYRALAVVLAAEAAADRGQAVAPEGLIDARPAGQ